MNQQKFSDTRVSKYFGAFGCDKRTIEDGEICKCSSNAILVVKANGKSKRYCDTHARKSWKRMAGIELE